MIIIRNWRVMLVAVVFALVADAAAMTASGQTATGVAPQDSTLQIPKVMFAGNSYIGIIHTTSDQKTIIPIASSNDGIITTDQSIFLAGRGNSQFGIVANAAGQADININFDGRIITKHVTVHENREDKKKLKLIFPANQTSTAKIQGLVYLLQNGLPVISDRDVAVQLFADANKIDAPKHVTIKKGGTAAMFDAYVYQDVQIRATADGIASDDFEIGVQKRDIAIRLEAAPVIMHHASSGYLSVSLYEDGMPFVGSQSLPLTIHTSNPQAISMNMGRTDKEAFDGFITDGTAIFRTYSQLKGVSTITVSVEGIGSESVSLFSGAVDKGTHNIAHNGTETAIPQIQIRQDDVTRTENIIPNTLFSEIIPSVTTGDAHLVTGMYYIEKDTRIDVTSENEIGISDSAVETFYPVLIDDRNIKITSDGADHATDVLFGTTDTKTHVNKFEVSGKDSREYAVAVSAPGIESTGNTVFTVTEPSSSSYGIRIKPLPVMQDYLQDIALITLHDGNGVMIDPRMGFDIQKEILVNVDGTRQGTYTFEHSPMIIIRDHASNVSHEVTVYESGKRHDTRTVTTLNSDAAGLKGHLFVPDTIYAFESFPAYGYLTDSEGTPTMPVDVLSLNGCKQTKDEEEEEKGQMITCTSTGSIGIHHRYGLPFEEIEPEFRYLNRTTFEIPSAMSVEGTYRIEIDGNYDDVTVNTDIPYEIQEEDRGRNSVIFLPKQAAKAEEITITLEKAGYHPKTVSSVTSVTDSFFVSVDAYNHEGYPIRAKYELSTHEGSTFTAPHTHVLDKFQTGIFFEDSFFDKDGNRYDLVRISLNGTKVTHDAQTITITPKTNAIYGINATYIQIVTLHVQDKYGNGYTKEYPVGTVVQPRPQPNHPIALFFIQDVFDGYGSDTADITMDEDIKIQARYREDHTWLLAAIISVMLIGVLALWKNDSEKIMKVVQAADTLFKGAAKSKKTTIKKRDGDRKTSQTGLFRNITRRQNKR